MGISRSLTRRVCRVTLAAGVVGVMVVRALKMASAKTPTNKPRANSGNAAWDSVYSVLTSPRCINCHTATNYPQQGDE